MSGLSSGRRRRAESSCPHGAGRTVAVGRAASASFEDVEAVDEVEHKVTVQRVGLRIAYAAGSYGTRDVASLLENVVNLETERALVVFQE